MRSFIAAVLICSAAPAFGKTVFGVKSISSGLGPTFVIAQNNRSAIAGAYRNGFSGAGFSGAQGQASALPSIPSSIACMGNELDCFPVPSGLTSHGNVVGYFSGLNPQTQIRFNDIFTWQPGDASLSNIVTVNPNSYQTCDISCHPAYLNNSGMIAYNTSDNGSGVPGAVFGRAGGTVQPIPGLASTAFITGLTNTNLVVGLVQLNSSSIMPFYFSGRSAKAASAA